MHKTIATRFFLIMAGLVFAANVMAAEPVSASNAWIRLLPDSLPLAGYVVLHNPNNQPVQLVSVAGSAFKRIAMHHSMSTDGMNHMKPVRSITIAPHSDFRFSPGGYHLMLWRRHALHKGDTTLLTLTFASGDRVAVKFAIEGPSQ